MMMQIGTSKKNYQGKQYDDISIHNNMLMLFQLKNLILIYPYGQAQKKQISNKLQIIDIKNKIQGCPKSIIKRQCQVERSRLVKSSGVET